MTDEPGTDQERQARARAALRAHLEPMARAATELREAFDRVAALKAELDADYERIRAALEAIAPPETPEDERATLTGQLAAMSRRHGLPVPSDHLDRIRELEERPIDEDDPPAGDVASGAEPAPAESSPAPAPAQTRDSTPARRSPAVSDEAARICITDALRVLGGEGSLADIGERVTLSRHQVRTTLRKMERASLVEAKGTTSSRRFRLLERGDRPHDPDGGDRARGMDEAPSKVDREWCPKCKEEVVPIKGACPFCDTRAVPMLDADEGADLERSLTAAAGVDPDDDQDRVEHGLSRRVAREEARSKSRPASATTGSEDKAGEMLRERILSRLRQAPLTVAQLADLLKVRPALVAHEVNQMKRDEVVRKNAIGRLEVIES